MFWTLATNMAFPAILFSIWCEQEMTLTEYESHAKAQLVFDSTVSVTRPYISHQKRGGNLQFSNALWKIVVEFLEKKSGHSGLWRQLSVCERSFRKFNKSWCTLRYNKPLDVRCFFILFISKLFLNWHAFWICLLFAPLGGYAHEPVYRHGDHYWRISGV